jgi:hypothetical protein
MMPIHESHLLVEPFSLPGMAAHVGASGIHDAARAVRKSR